MRFKLGVAAAVLGLAFQPAPAMAQTMITGVGVADLAPILAENGWTAEPQTKDGIQTPFIALEFEGFTGWAKLMDCPGETLEGCEAVLLFANFDLGGKISSDQAALVNKFNDSQAAGRAYYFLGDGEDADQVGVDYRISLQGGVTRQHLAMETVSFRNAVVALVEVFSAE